MHYFEVSRKTTEVFPEVNAFDTLEEAIEFADKNNGELITEIGGGWYEYKKCWYCDEWVDITTMNSNSLCDKCESYLISRGEI